VSTEDANRVQEVRAEDLIKELAQETSEQNAGKKPLLPLSNARVWGEVDLKHHTIKKPVEIRDCDFEGEVDLRYCEFSQVVDFSGCTFHKEFNGEAVYKKDLICNRATFDGTAKFNGARVENSAYFSEANFLSESQSVDFTGGTFETSLECNKATFQGPASFMALKCNGVGMFSEANFRGEASFAYASFGTKLEFRGAQFENPADLHLVKCRELFCCDAIFEGGVSFVLLECEGSGLFHNTKFRGKDRVSFDSASFVGNQSCRGATFEGSATFDSLTCNDLSCAGATFEGGASFISLECNGSGLFNGAKFTGKEGVRLNGSSFGQFLFCNGTTFEGSAIFDSLKCNRGGFNDAKFHSKKVNFAHASFDVELQCKRTQIEGSASFFALKSASMNLERAQFGGSVDLSAAHISQNLILTDARFHRTVSLYDASVDMLVLEGERFPFEDYLDLRECTFSRFRSPQDELERAMELANAQDPTKFSRDPYLQLEKYYESIGNDAQARRIYYQGRCELRENAKAQNNWSSLKSFTDLVWKVLTGYGVDIRPLLLISSTFLVIG